jgi:hypothetical protein
MLNIQWTCINFLKVKQIMSLKIQKIEIDMKLNLVHSAYSKFLDQDWVVLTLIKFKCPLKI